MTRRRLVSLVIFGIVAAAMFASLERGRRARATTRPARELVLYCATDREVAQSLIDQFERESGIRVLAKYDTEAARAVGLVQEIREERSRPRCDVLWGGGGFFNAQLAADGLLAPAPADLIAAHGDAPRDAAGRWLGFAGVYRVIIVNTDALPDAAQRPRSILDLTDARLKGRVGVANPLFGGMAGHVAALVSTRGEPFARAWLRGLRANDVAICAGMADVRNRVASGELWAGITSTVDARVALAGGKPVAVIFPDQDDAGLGCLNGHSAAAVIAGAPHPAEAEAFLRFLVSPRTERALAAGPGQNVGLLPASVAARVRPAWIPADVKAMRVDWADAAAIAPLATRAVHEDLLGR